MKLSVYKCRRCLREFTVDFAGFNGKTEIACHKKVNDQEFRCGPLDLIGNPFPHPDIDYLDDEE